MKKLLVISGPTATGKTDLAVILAKRYNGELVSADSRQVYQDMDIGTGKDHPRDIVIHLVDIIKPNQGFSVAEYKKLALNAIKKIQSENKLPILVGGTGFYIDSVLGGQSDTYDIKPNIILRKILSYFSVSSLQKIYSVFDEKAYLSLNNSEKHNPHRLIRKIEISLSEIFGRKSKKNPEQSSFNVLHVSLTAPNQYLYKKIDNRVDVRLKLGLVGEINELLKHYSWSDIGLKTIAYCEFREFFDSKDKKDFEESVQRWKFDEHALARRQKTWFKKSKNAKIYDVTNKKYIKDIQAIVEKWYNTP